MDEDEGRLYYEVGQFRYPIFMQYYTLERRQMEAPGGNPWMLKVILQVKILGEKNGYPSWKG
ncbi:MAG: hypothetical protein JXR49_18980 [Acidobacteria bacterium]|nr:hypothetical protein [Acidobacteriota bacterium]